MDVVEQAERTALRADDTCVVLTLRESRAIRQLIQTAVSPAGVRGISAMQNDVGRAWRVLCNQIDWLENPDAPEDC